MLDNFCAIRGRTLIVLGIVVFVGGLFAPLIGPWVASIPNAYNYNPVLHTVLPGLGTLIQILFRVETGVILALGGVLLERIEILKEK
ncbi:hypothetical protein [Varibaculum prostatecancerukia]|uniref:hypothetical protein n=1 Tax=Varibaculum prostatecancerukia TaxID=2811781 RepID=UPI001C00012C|nr:hypothetical protein [Varibaculum prostatecancerukia]